MTNISNGKAERLGQIFVMNGKERRDVGKLVAGDIGPVVDDDRHPFRPNLRLSLHRRKGTEQTRHCRQNDP